MKIEKENDKILVTIEKTDDSFEVIDKTMKETTKEYLHGFVNGAITFTGNMTFDCGVEVGLEMDELYKEKMEEKSLAQVKTEYDELVKESVDLYRDMFLELPESIDGLLYDYEIGYMFCPETHLFGYGKYYASKLKTLEKIIKEKEGK